MTRLFSKVALASVMFGAACLSSQAQNIVPTVPGMEAYKLVWNDEFDGTKVNQNNWVFEDWAPGRVNRELQRYVPNGERNGIQTAKIEDGALVITALKDGDEVISARMNSTSNWKYCYTEARIQIPKGKGTWPAYWMMPVSQKGGWPACGEIDIMEEVGYDPNNVHATIHTRDYNHVKGTQKGMTLKAEGANEHYVVYALEWTEDYLQFYVDGVPSLRFENDGTGNVSTWPFDKEFYIILNLAWGGGWGGAQGIDESALPIQMKVDYVRVFQK